MADLVARVTVTHPAVVTPAVEALAAAIPHRHTNRWPFARTPVPAETVEKLRDAACLEGAVLATVQPGWAAGRPDRVTGPMALSADCRRH